MVRESQPTQWGWTPEYGRLEVRARMELSPRSMAAVWMVGLEDQPERCGEICIFEVFGDAPDGDGPTAAVGMGVHPFRDPALTDEFDAPRMRDRRRRAPRLRRRLAARTGGLPRRRRAREDRRAGAGLPDADDGRGVRLPRAAASAPTEHVPLLAVDYVTGDRSAAARS